MEFEKVALLFESLERKNKRLEKILILRDFLLEYKEEAPVIFDFITGNFQREHDKKSLGISIKTLFDVLSFISKADEKKIEKQFNKFGDIGTVFVDVISKDNKQIGLFITKELQFSEIILTFKKISTTSGTNKNKIKKELLGNLFLQIKKKEEYKFLARLLIDDLRIGVSEGVLKEAVVNAYFPQVLGVNLICECGYSNLNLERCFKCSKPLDVKNNIDVASKRYKVIEVGTPKGTLGLDNFIGKTEEEEMVKFMLRLKRDTHIIQNEIPRNIYNKFLELYEMKYNTINSFKKTIKELNSDLAAVININIKIGTPLRSMLGTRTNNIKSSFETTEKPSFIDFKYDGLRVQIHNNKGDIKLFSRNLENITKQFPEVIEFIKENFSDISFVIDAECVGFDFDKMQFLPFQTLSRRIMSKNINDVSHIKVVVKAFDMMYLNGETLISLPYIKRRELLDGLFINKELIQKTEIDIKKIK